MTSESFKKISIFLMLGLLMASAFFMRLENFKNSRMRSIDEIVYYRMAEQILEEGLSGYNTIPYGKEMSDAGRPLPDYFFQPLFKHPPVFTFLAALSMKIFGVNIISAEYVALLFSVLMLPLIYWLGALVYGRWVGFLSALFLWIDPISIICSQKVWMDSAIAFFTLLSACCFAWGLKRNKDWFFILSGLAGGLAVNTKYTGIFIVFIIALYAILYHCTLFKNEKFQLGLSLPFVSLIPWLYWNYKVYGMASVLGHSELLTAYRKLLIYAPLVMMGAVLGIFVFRLFGRKKKNTAPITPMAYSNECLEPIQWLSLLLPFGLFVLLVPKQFLHGLQFNYLPIYSWQQGIFSQEPPAFYFGKLLEYSLIYALSFFSIFMYHPKEKNETPLIRLCAMVILIFFIFWGNFQSRYILSSLPFLIILGVQFGVGLYDRASKSENTLIYLSGRIGLKALLFFIILKSYYLNCMVSFPNDMCYF